MSEDLRELLRPGSGVEFAKLMAIWRGRDAAQWAHSPEFYRAIAEKMLRRGEPLLAFDVASEGSSTHPADVRLRQLRGLALARSGASASANAILEQLRSEGQADEETLGMLGRTYKDLALHAATPNERADFLKRAAKTYAQAYEATGGYWTGINAATMSLLCGETDRARELAREVQTQGVAAFAREPGQYWLLAALGEAALILREWSQAGEWYERAARVAGNRFGDTQSSRRNARLILEHWNQDRNWIDRYLCIPAVIAFSGHMIDMPGRATPRFPAELEPAVARQIQDRIAALKPGFGFSSAACGSDILFLEAMLEAGAEIAIVLPYKEEAFVRDSVDFVPGANWRARFSRLLEKSARVITASSQRLEIGGISYEFCNQLLFGLAAIRARQLDAQLIPLIVWDGLPGDGPGGAASVVESWRASGCEPEIIDLSAMSPARAKPRAAIKSAGSTESRRPGIFGSRIVAILFADAIGFSKLGEAEVPRFIEHFLGAVAQWSEKLGQSVLTQNTWGDALYFVFSDVDSAGKFALAVADLASSTDWQAKGLPADLSLRIALHAGPAYEFMDPITGTRTYGGTHVSRTARMEPITPRGQVYASEAFAALAAARAVKDFTCDYVGQIPLAKSYGTLPTYHVRAAVKRTSLPD